MDIRKKQIAQNNYNIYSIMKKIICLSLLYCSAHAMTCDEVRFTYNKVLVNYEQFGRIDESNVIYNRDVLDYYTNKYYPEMSWSELLSAVARCE